LRDGDLTARWRRYVAGISRGTRQAGHDDEQTYNRESSSPPLGHGFLLSPPFGVGDVQAIGWIAKWATIITLNEIDDNRIQ
jgi:hypothetical protein